MKEMTLKATVENIPRVTEFIDGLLEDAGCSVKAQLQIDMAIDELFGNIANYAYAQGAGEATVRFAYDEAERMASVTFIDGGVPFNPLDSAEPDVTLPAEARGIGGLGIFLVRKTMDRLDYRFENGKNILTLYKHI